MEDSLVRQLFDNHCRWYTTLLATSTQAELLDYLSDPEAPLSYRSYGRTSLIDLTMLLQSVHQVDACLISDTVYFELEPTSCMVSTPATLLTNLARPCNQRFGFIPVAVLSPQTDTMLGNIGHANLLLIDYQTQRIEHFEPHGEMRAFQCGLKPFVLNDAIDEWVHNVLLLQPTFRDFTYVPTLAVCPAIGLQSKELDLGVGGFCRVYTALYLHLRLLEPDVPAEDVIERLLAWSPTELTNAVLRYAHMLEELLPVASGHNSKAEREVFTRAINKFRTLLATRPYAELVNPRKCAYPLITDQAKPRWHRTPFVDNWWQRLRLIADSFVSSADIHDDRAEMERLDQLPEKRAAEQRRLEQEQREREWIPDINF